MEKKYSLPSEFATKWAAALRSGDYQQGQGELTIGRDNEDGFAYCCLGVACKIAGMTDNSLHPYSSLGIGETLFKEAGIPQELTNTALERVLMELNDNEGYTFPQIADWIEKNCEFVEAK